uniref:Uncharacterized protein n=1 Tax=Anguilla anguilla TaxID=7936 RepID=A0A0E9S5A6_ANGAN
MINIFLAILANAVLYIIAQMH